MVKPLKDEMSRPFRELVETHLPIGSVVDLRAAGVAHKTTVLPSQPKLFDPWCWRRSPSRTADRGPRSVPREQREANCGFALAIERSRHRSGARSPGQGRREREEADHEVSSALERDHGALWTHRDLDRS